MSIETIRIRYFAAAAHAGGVEEEQRDRRPNDTIATLLARAVAERPGLAAVLPRCSYLLDAIAAADDERVVGDADILDVLPPFAGG